ncbi:putative alternative oxidase [Podospora aff. communis PSN243]|uniref:Alternative oxidase n=1 Tax=Podospora aff. communis PSN243 TaxID=3040156 RepID=A0AAV9GR44_9PEZI|nr:putative alternative oxidase [Podospora aff. communis PSN243]
MALFHTLGSASRMRPPFALRGSTAPSPRPYFVRRLFRQSAASTRLGSHVNGSHQLKHAPQPTLHVTWPHQGWDDRVVLGVVPSHRKPVTVGDHLAWRLTKMCRWAMDLITGMKPNRQGKSTTLPLTETQWLVRFIFLESIAGVPGMVAGTVRHLHSIRRFKQDRGWIKTLLEESYNERMHLLTFLELYKPGWMMRCMVFAAQGIFYNTMFVSYLISPRTCHRFVGYLEEEAVHTYTKCLVELDNGSLPRWASSDFQIPDIAIKYWNMPERRRTMRDLLLYVRADEASHRGVNHTLGNLDQTSDPNPVVDGKESSGHMRAAVASPQGLGKGGKLSH